MNKNGKVPEVASRNVNSAEERLTKVVDLEQGEKYDSILVSLWKKITKEVLKTN